MIFRKKEDLQLPKPDPRFEYHYNREERLKSASENVKNGKDKKGIFKRNPALLILLIDVIVIILVSRLVVPYFLSQRSTAEIQKYHFSLKAFRMEDEVYARVLVRLTEKREGKSPPPATIIFRYKQKASPPLQDVLPQEPNNEFFFKFRFPYSKETVEVFAEISFAGETKELRTEFSAE